MYWKTPSGKKPPNQKGWQIPARRFPIKFGLPLHLNAPHEVGIVHVKRRLDLLWRWRGLVFTRAATALSLCNGLGGKNFTFYLLPYTFYLLPLPSTFTFYLYVYLLPLPFTFTFLPLPFTFYLYLLPLPFTFYLYLSPLPFTLKI